MLRSLLLFAALALVTGCKKGRDSAPAEPDGPNTGNPNPKADAAKPKSGGEPISSEVLKLQPRTTFKLPGQRFNSSSLQVSADGRTLAVVLQSAQICVYDISGEPKLIGQYAGYKAELSPSGKRLFAFGGLFREVYDLSTKKQIGQLLLNYADGCSHAYFRDENTIVYTGRSHNFPKATKGRITVWDLAKKAEASSFEIPDNRFGEAFPMAGGKEMWLMMSNQKFEIECYDVAARKLLRTIKALDENGRPISTAPYLLSLAPDGSAVAAVTQIFNASTGKLVYTLPHSVLATESGLLPPDGRFYLGRDGQKRSSGGEKEYLLYDWKSQRVAAVLTGHRSADAEAIATADGRTLVSVTKSGEGLIFDLSGVK